MNLGRSFRGHLFAMALLGVTLAASSAWSAGTQLWDFEDGAQDWEPANGTWKVKGGVYQETSGGEPAMHSLVGEDKWDDYVVEARIRIDKGNWAGLIFRAQSEFEYYVYYLNIPDNKSELWRHKQGAFDARDAINSNVGAQGGVVIQNGKWLDVKVSAEGDTFQLWINDELQAELTDGAYKKGKIGVWAWTSAASFDDVTITGDNVENTLAVEPRGKLALTWASLRQSE